MTLPPGWVWTTLGEVCLPPQYGWTTSASADGSLHLLRTTDITSGKIDWESVPFCRDEPPDKDKYLLRDGDIVISRAGSVGYSHLVKNPRSAVFASYLIRFRPLIHEQYVAYFLQSPPYWESISEKSLGIAIPNVNASKLKQIAFPLAPLPEQRRIVAKIEELFTRLDAGVAALRRAQANVKRYKAAVLKAACEGRLVPQDPNDEPASSLLERILAERRKKWEADLRAKGQDPSKAKYVQPKPPDTDGLPELPSGWCWVSLPQIGKLARGKSKHRPRNEKKLFGGPYPFIQTGEIRQANGLITTYTETYSEFGLAQSRLWPKGTLCITIAANIAETAILGFDACFPDSVVGFVPDEGVCDVNFVEFFIRTVKQDLEQYAPATAQKNINLDTLQNLAVAFPPLAEQHRIVAEVERRLSVVQKLEAVLVANLARAERLRQSILKQAFEGRLVPQDPNDEPASVLLEKIRAQAKISQRPSGRPRRKQP